MPADSKIVGADAHRTGFIDHALGDGLLIVCLVAWWGYAGSVPEYIFPSPAAVGQTLFEFVSNPDMLVHVFSTLTRVIVAVLAATILGSALALLASYVPMTDEIVHGRIKPMLLSFPSIGWALIALVWFNISNTAVIFVEVAVLVPFCLVNVSEGLREIDRELLEMANSFTRTKSKIFGRIIWPLLYPFLVAAMRMGYGVGLKISLVAEVFGATSGLGYLMYQGEETANTPLVFASCVAIVILYALGEKLIFDPLSRVYRGQAKSTTGDVTPAI
jgi:NitT/TauT family transport system permease protein/sulfonate transport system permease protein